MTACAPPSEDCAPKKLTGSRLLECKSRPKIPQLVFIPLEFVSKNCVFVLFVNSRRISFKFWDEDLFFLVFTSDFVENRKNFETTTRICENFGTKTFFYFFGLHLFRLIHTRINFSCPPWIHIIELLVPPKFLSVPPPPSHAILAPGLLWAIHSENIFVKL